MYVHDATGLVYLANPRTASRATAKALLGIGFRMVGSHHSGPGRSVLLREFRTSFTTVRDLLDTLRSWSRKLGEHPDEPGDTWGHMLATNQLGIIEGWEPWTLFPHARAAHRLLRYEHLDDDLNALLAEHGLGPVTLERVE